MRGENQIPDFKSGWKLYRIMDFLAKPLDKNDSKEISVGAFKFYINEKTGDLGLEILNLQKSVICIMWGKKVRYRDKESILYYLSYILKDEKGERKRIVYRIKEPKLVAELRRDTEGEVYAFVAFDLMIGRKSAFSIYLK